jgi:CHASE3 domain sensor protein
MTSALEKRIAVRFAAVAAILIAANVAGFVSIGRFLEISGRVEHSHVVTQELSDLISLLKDAESGQRGFLLTGGKRSYLAPYIAATREIDRKAQDFGRLAGDDPMQRRLTEELAPLIDRKLAELAATIRLYDAGDARAALALVHSDEGQTIMDEIRARVARMQAYERVRLERFAADVRWIRGELTAIKLAHFALIMGVLVAVYRLVRREMEGRRRSQEAQARLVDILEATTDFVGIADESDRLVYVSRAGRQMVGKSEEEISRTRIADYYPDRALGPARRRCSSPAGARSPSRRSSSRTRIARAPSGTSPRSPATSPSASGRRRRSDGRTTSWSVGSRRGPPSSSAPTPR